MARARLRTLPQVWAVPLASLLTAGEDRTSQLALAVLRASPPGPADAPVIEAALVGVGRDAHRPVALRVEALAAASGGLPRVESDLFTVLQKALAPTEPVALRMQAASCFGRGSTRRSCWR